jgi:hypothetical protein
MVASEMAAVQGERISGGFILITGIDGIRYAVRHNSVAVIHDADECQDETLVQLHGGAVCGCPARSTKCWLGSGRKPILRRGNATAYAPKGHARLPIKPARNHAGVFVDCRLRSNMFRKASVERTSRLWPEWPESSMNQRLPTITAWMAASNLLSCGVTGAFLLGTP